VQDALFSATGSL